MFEFSATRDEPPFVPRLDEGWHVTPSARATFYLINDEISSWLNSIASA